MCACAPAMKALLWKPFRKWTSDVYTGSSQNRTKASVKPSKVEHSKRELTSQDPIVETDEDSNNIYRLDSMDFNRNGHIESEQDLEKAIRQNHSRSSNENDKTPTSQTLYDPTEPKLQISKETTFQVSYLSDASLDKTKDSDGNGITALPLNQRNSRGQVTGSSSSPTWEGASGTRRSNPNLGPSGPQTTPPQRS